MRFSVANQISRAWFVGQGQLNRSFKVKSAIPSLSSYGLRSSYAGKTHGILKVFLTLNFFMAFV